MKSRPRIHPPKKVFIFIISLAFSYGIGFHPLQASLGPGHKDSSPGLQFTSRGHVMAFQPGGIYVASGDHALRTTFVRGRNVQPRANQPLQEKGPVTALNRVTYPQLWDGVSLTYEAVEGGIVKSTFRLNPRARVEDIRLRYNAPLKVDKAGALHLAYAMGEMNESTPVAWQDINGRRLPVTAAFRLYSQHEAGFVVGKYDSAYPLVIDPVLTWTSFLGAGSYDAGHAITISREGIVDFFLLVVGTSENTWGGPIRAHAGGRDVFVAKLDQHGNRVWHTFLGSSSTDEGRGIAVDGGFNVYVSGYSSATWGDPIRDYGGNGDAFVAKLNTNGVLQWNTFLGSASYDFGERLDYQGGNLYLTGVSNATWGGDPVRGHSGSGDAFVAKVNTSGVLQWNTFLGSSGYENGRGISVDSTGNAYVTGYTTATWGTPRRAYSGGGDAFVAKVNTSGVLQWNTFLGSSGFDEGWGIAVDGSGNSFITGDSRASWETPYRSHSGGSDAFVARLSNNGDLEWNTFLGSSQSDYGRDIALAGSTLLVVGHSYASWYTPARSYTGGSDGFLAKLNSDGLLLWNTFVGSFDDDFLYSLAPESEPYIIGVSSTTWGSSINDHTGGEDAMLARLNSTGSWVYWNTFMGSSKDDQGQALAFDGEGNILVAGTSQASWGTPIRAHSGGQDAYVAKLNSLGSLRWVTFLGSAGTDKGYGVAVDRNNNVYVTGNSFSTWGEDPILAHSGNHDAFVAKLTSNGTLIWNTFLGSSSGDYGRGIAVGGAADNVYVIGQSGGSVFAAKLSSNGALQWTSYMGSSEDDLAGGIAVDQNEYIYIVGSSLSSWGDPVRYHSGGGFWDAFAAKYNSSGTRIWNTFLGSGHDDFGSGIAVDGSGNVYVTGTSFLTWGTPRRAHAGDNDAFVVKLNNIGRLQWNTFLGSAIADSGSGLVVDPRGGITVVGNSSSTWGTPLRPYAGGGDAFLARLNNSGDLQWNLFLGSPLGDSGQGIALSGNDELAVVGTSRAPWGPMQRSYAGGEDGFLVRFTSPVFLPIIMK